VPSEESKGQLQTQHSLDTGKYIIDKHKLQASTGGSNNNNNINRTIDIAFIIIKE
jgi:hypothetical protein